VVLFLLQKDEIMNSEEEKTTEEESKEKESKEKEEGIKEEAVKTQPRTAPDNFIKFSIGAGVLLVSLSISYYFAFFLPSKEKTQTRNLEKCLISVNSNYEKAWDYNCDQLSRDKNCTLPLPIAESLDKYYREQKEDCLKKISAQ
jgi:hypothetical protein